MKKSFTLIELLVVIMILIFIMSIVLPSGKALLEGFQKKSKLIEKNYNLQLLTYYSFIRDSNFKYRVDNELYCINNKGIIFNEKECYDNNRSVDSYIFNDINDSQFGF